MAGCVLALGVASPALGAEGARSQLPVNLPIPLPVDTPIPLPPGLTDAGAPLPGTYQQDDGRGFFDILPPGQNGLVNPAQLAAYEASGGKQKPPHNDDQLGMYGDLVYATPGLAAQDITKYFKDASFGVRPADVERVYSPRGDVTIVRDKGFGVPHVYGSTRSGAMFGLGYVAAEDRLFFIDVLRHLGRAQLSSFAGGAPGNRAFDREQWQIAPYTEADLQRQADQFVPLYGAEGAQIRDDVESYVAGINQYIDEAKLNPVKMPGEYAAINKPLGPDAWKVTDVIATAALVGGIFGKGGGGELDSAAVLQKAQQRFGAKPGRAAWADFREADDADAPTTVKRASFPYEVPPAKPARGSLAIPDAGSFEPLKTDKPAAGTPALPGGASGGPLGGLASAFPSAMSNALVVSGAKSADGRPLAVFGPQTGYFSPQILMEEDVHGPGIDARGAAFPGVNLYVEVGRGRDYAWSATSAGQDIIDTFALPLCNPDGSRATLESDHYRYHGSCRAIETLDRANSWTPNFADQTAPGSETLHAERTALGIVAGRGTVHGRPVLYTKLRSTYMHEVDSARGFADFNSPDKMRSAADFQRAAYKIGYTFNWLYADDRDVAYFNSGNNPVRAAGVDPNFPAMGTSRFEWRGFDPNTMLADYTPFEQHPRVINQDWITSWNNKQAHGYRSADGNFSFGSVFRSSMLDDQIRKRLAGGGKMTLPRLIDSMEEAGTTDLRGAHVLPLALRVLGRPSNPQLRSAVATLRAWYRSGAQRRDRNRDGVYDHAKAVQIMDAWWPRMMHAEFEPSLGGPLFDSIESVLQLDNSPNNHGDHLGSAYQDGWYGYAIKDLKRILGLPTKAPYSRAYCGRGKPAACRRALASSLRAALKVPASKLYGGDQTCRDAKMDGSQWCYDAVRMRPLGAVSQPLIHWINRPTFQQAVEVQSHRPR